MQTIDSHQELHFTRSCPLLSRFPGYKDIRSVHAFLFTTAVFTLSFLHAGHGFFSAYTQRTATLFSLRYFFHIPGEFLNSSFKILKLQLFLSGNFSSSLFTHQLLLVDFCCVVNIAGDVIAGNPCIYIAVVLLKVHSSSLVP